MDLMKKREKFNVTLSVDKHIWFLFKNYTLQSDMTLSSAVQRLIKKELCSNMEYKKALFKDGVLVGDE